MSLISKLVGAWHTNVRTLAKASRSRWEENGMPPVLDSSYWETPTIDLDKIELIEDTFGVVFPKELNDFFLYKNGIKMPGFGADGELLAVNRICNFLDSEAISLANRIE